MDKNDGKRVYREGERALFEQLENILEAGINEITLDEQRYRVKRGRGEDWLPFFILEPVESS